MALSAANGSIINTSRFSFRVYLDTGIASRYAAVYFQVALQSAVRTIVILSVRLSVCLSVRLFVCQHLVHRVKTAYDIIESVSLIPRLRNACHWVFLKLLQN